jgi:hypothetical protein
MLGTTTISAYAKGGDSVTLEATDDDWGEDQGTDGEVIRTEKVNNVYKGTIRTVQGSAINELLSAAFAKDKLDKLSLGPFLLQDTRGTTQADGPTCWISKLPPVKFGEDAAPIEWPFTVTTPKVWLGQNIRNV